jgi:hypothetical protein
MIRLVLFIAAFFALLVGLSFAQLPGASTPMLSGGGCTQNTEGGGTFANVKGLWHFDNNLNDSSGRGHFGTVTGAGAVLSATQSKFGGYSVSISGASQVTVAGGPDFNWGTTSDFTYEFWLYQNSGMTTASYSSTWGNWTTDGNLGEENGSGQLYIYYDGSSGSFTDSYTRVAGVWQHWAWVRSGGATGVMTVFVDGVQQGTALSVSGTVGGNSNWAIGNFGGQNPYYMTNGYIDEFRVSNIARYTANFTPPTQPWCNN